MSELLGQFLGIAQDLLWAGFLVLLRVGALIGLLPGIGERAVSMRVRLGLALTLSVLLAPTVQLPSVIPAEVIGIFILGIGEIAIGLVIGLSIRFLAHGLLVAGSIVAQATSLAQLFGSAMADGPQPAIALVLYWGGLALFMITGMPLQIVISLSQSYQFLPIGSGIDMIWSMNWVVQAVSYAFALGFALAAPFVVSALLYNVAMGVINKAMPQLMVSFVGAPALTLGGLLLLLVAAPVVLSVWYDALQTHGLTPFGISQ